MDIFTGFWSIVKEIFGSIKVIKIIMPWEGGIQIRMGKFYRVVGAGWWVHRPFGIDTFTYMNVKPKALTLDEQALTTLDAKDIVVQGVCIWSVFDVKKAIVDVDDAEDTLDDIALGIIQDVVENEEWDYLRTEACRRDIKKRIQRQARKWGVSISSFKWQSIVQARTFKLFGST